LDWCATGDRLVDRLRAAVDTENPVARARVAEQNSEDAGKVGPRDLTAEWR
jgi:hypothetical protein